MVDYWSASRDTPEIDDNQDIPQRFSYLPESGFDDVDYDRVVFLSYRNLNTNDPFDRLV